MPNGIAATSAGDPLVFERVRRLEVEIEALEAEVWRLTAAKTSPTAQAAVELEGERFYVLLCECGAVYVLLLGRMTTCVNIWYLCNSSKHDA